jgi:hypothetical protein
VLQVRPAQAQDLASVRLVSVRRDLTGNKRLCGAPDDLRNLQSPNPRNYVPERRQSGRPYNTPAEFESELFAPISGPQLPRDAEVVSERGLLRVDDYGAGPPTRNSDAERTITTPIFDGLVEQRGSKVFSCGIAPTRR